ncbi:MAG TPA: hypothetical protein VLZ54_10960 [Arenibacter sp.]|nr:hypothetical protein [Arenibacter sp.]
MNNTIIKLFGAFTVMLLFGCGGNDDGPAEPVIALPMAAVLSTPADDEVCLNGRSVNEIQSEVKFIWEASGNTDSYDLVLKNLKTGQSSTYATTSETQNVTLNKGEPYSWFVISKVDKSKETAQSATWKFYLAGDGIVSYAPFPAELKAPEMGSSLVNSNGTVNLSWKGSDADSDISGYEVLFDVVTPPLTTLGTTSDEFMNAAVAPVNIYYWQVITKDEKGNTSSSEVFQFKVG